MSELRKRQREARRTLRKSQKAEKDEIRETNRADRKATKAAVKTIKKESRNKRRDRVNDAGEDVRMSRSERRADRRATNKAGRTVKRAAKKVRKKTRKDDRIENRAERRGQRSGQKETRKIMRKITKDEKTAKEEALLNKKVNAIKHQKVVDTHKPVNSNTKPLNTKEQNEADAAYYQSDADKAANSDANRIKKESTTKNETKKEQSFSEAFRENRDKKGNDSTFMWKGKKYTTRIKKEQAIVDKNKKKHEESEKNKNKIVVKEETSGNDVEDHTGPGGKFEGQTEVVSTTAPGPGWTKTKGTNIWKKPKAKKRKGGTRYEEGGFLEPGIERLFED